MAQISIGTCSWTDPTLLATDFYPRETNTPERRLRYYASQFSLVEVDSTYYSIPAQTVVRRWAKCTPEDFTFDVKSFSLFTQHPTKIKSIPRDIKPLISQTGKSTIYYSDVPESIRELLWQRFNETLLPLDSTGKLGVVLLQFPEWFLPGKTSNYYLLECKRNLPQYRLAVEFRNSTWLSENSKQETLNFLKENDLVYVCVDEPQGFKSSESPIAAATSDISIVRFHGRNTDNWNKKGISVAERFKYLYSDEELDEWLPRLAELASKVKQLHVLFNNCYEDFGIRNAHDIDRLMRPQPLLFPDYACLHRHEKITTSHQLSLTDLEI